MKTGLILASGLAVVSMATAVAPLPPPVITGLNMDDSRLVIHVESVSNVVLTVQTTDQLESGDWESSTTLYAPTDSTVLDDYLFARELSAFYRVRMDPPNTVSNGVYHGWPNALTIENGEVYAVIVPATGRIMQFGAVGSASEVFWENRALDGVIPDPDTSWQNFGGDKAWPAPQDDWYTGSKRWPPPSGFDGTAAYTASEAGGEVWLRSPVDSSYGIQVTRHIRLFPGELRMRVTTTYEQMTSITNQVSIWVVSQLQDSERLFFPVPDNSLFANGYHVMSATPPPDLLVINGLVSFSRNPLSKHKVGSDCERLLWVGSEYSLEVDAPRLLGEEYPDSNSSAEIFVSPDPNKYIELELLGPLTELRPGETLSFGMNYTLHPRVLTDPQLEAERILQ